MEGMGRYKLPSGNMYEGEMKDGMYHGNGKIMFPDGGVYSGTFSKGYPGYYRFPDGLVFSENNWQYCDGYDRRFETEIKHGLNAPGEEKLTDGPTMQIPPKFYDVGDGFYDPENRIVFDYKMRFLRNADVADHEWNVKYGRKGWDEFTNGQSNSCRPELSDPLLNDGEWMK
nr:MORN repeat containing protein 5 [Hymenolepis microstoma]